MTNRKAHIYYADNLAGILEEVDSGYRFTYDDRYAQNPDSQPVSLILPITKEPYNSKVLFPFFDGLIPEGWLLEIGVKNWKINPRDRMGLLLAFCRDAIGAVSVVPSEEIDGK